MSPAERSWRLRAAEALAGQRLLLQRVPPTVTAASAAKQLSEWAARSFVVIDSLSDWRAECPWAVLDGRAREVEGLEDARRAELLARPGSLLILLDRPASIALAQSAPQLVSAAGGVALPEPSGVVRITDAAACLAAHEELERALGNHPATAARANGKYVAIEIVSSRLFLPEPGSTALQVAEECLDTGSVYLGWVDGP